MAVSERLEFAHTWSDGTDLDFVTENALTWVDYLADIDVGSCAVDQAPFWDDDDGADADATTSALPWYENVADWVITGFIAAAFTPGAAIVYRTTVPKARVFFRRNQWGAGFRALLNGVQMLTGDTYSAITDVLGVTLDFAGFATANGLGAAPWDFRIEHDSVVNIGATPLPGQGFGLEVVRGRLRTRLKTLYGENAPTLQTLLTDYQNEYGVTVQVIEDIRVTGGQIQVRYLGQVSWVNVTNAEFVRRDGSLDPDISAATRVAAELTADSLVVGTAALGRQYRLGIASFELRLQSAVNVTSAPLVVGSSPAAHGIRIDEIFRARINMAHQRQTSTSAWRDAARFDAGWSDNTDAARRGNFALTAQDTSGSRTVVSGASTGLAASVGFLGAAPIVRPSVIGGDAGNEALRALLTALETYGLITDATTEETPIDYSSAQARCRVALGVPVLFLQAAKRLVDAHLAAEPLNLFDDAAYVSIVRAYGAPWRDENVVKEWLQDHDLNATVLGDPSFGNYTALWSAISSASGNVNLESQMSARLLEVMPSGGYLTETTITAWNAALDTLTGTVARVRYFFRLLIEFTDPLAWASWANTANGFAFADCGELDVSIEFVTVSTYAVEGSTIAIPVRLIAPGGFALDRALTFRLAFESTFNGTGQASDIFINPGASFTFLAGAVNGATTNASVQVVNDGLVEPTEGLRVALVEQSYGAIGTRSNHLITIVDEVWCYTIDLTAFNGSFAVYEHPEWGALGQYIAGTGWRSRQNLTRSLVDDRYTAIRIDRALPPATYTRIDVDVNVTFGVNTAYPNGLYVAGDGVILANTASNGLQTLTWTGSNSIGTLRIGEPIGYRAAPINTGGEATITRITFRGTGSNPFPSNNCP